MPPFSGLTFFQPPFFYHEITITTTIPIPTPVPLRTRCCCLVGIPDGLLRRPDLPAAEYPGSPGSFFGRAAGLYRNSRPGSEIHAQFHAGAPWSGGG